MVPTIGNKFAYKDFLSRPKTGTHVHVDLNSFGKINKRYGHDVGDMAIKSAFNAAREALDETVGKKYGKAWRTGGDEGRFHVPTPQHAAAFAKRFQEKLDALSPINGEFKYSASVGSGPTPQHAESALASAKQDKIKANYPEHETKGHYKEWTPEIPLLSET
jgi:diguanylate cyclase (GGDEF)-like protein